MHNTHEAKNQRIKNLVDLLIFQQKNDLTSYTSVVDAVQIVKLCKK